MTVALEQINYTVLDITDEIETVAQKIIDMRILINKSYDDCQHGATSTILEYNCISSWNFKYIVDIKMIHGVKAIINLMGYKTIDILSLSVLLESER